MFIIPEGIGARVLFVGQLLLLLLNDDSLILGMNQVDEGYPGQIRRGVADNLFQAGVGKFNDLVLDNIDTVVGVFHQKAIFFLAFPKGLFRFSPLRHIAQNPVESDGFSGFIP